MSRALIIPAEYLEKLVKFSEWFKQSIKSQILQAIERHIEGIETKMIEKVVYFFSSLLHFIVKIDFYLLEDIINNDRK